MNNTKNSPLNQDVKFDTTLHNYGKRAHLMTDKERSNYREGMGIALSFAPIPAAKGVSILGNIVSKIISKAPQIKKVASAFANTAKQYLKPSRTVNENLAGWGLKKSKGKPLYQGEFKVPGATIGEKTIGTPYIPGPVGITALSSTAKQLIENYENK